jgi:hypothetical protein
MTARLRAWYMARHERKHHNCPQLTTFGAIVKENTDTRQ